MKIYHYHPATGVYLGESIADKCPVSGVDLIPAFAVAQAPPVAGDNQYVVFENGGWVIKDISQPEPLTPVEVEAAAWTSLRAERNSRLKDPSLTDRLDRYRNQRDGGIPTADTAEWFTTALLYLQALRDLPEHTADPANPVWPQPPA